MSLAEQIQRVDGGQNDTLKAILTALGVTVSNQKIDQLAALAATISPKLKPDNLNSAETNALYGLGADAVPDDVLAKIRSLISETASSVPRIECAKTTGTSITFSFSPTYVVAGFIPPQYRYIVDYKAVVLSQGDSAIIDNTRNVSLNGNVLNSNGPSALSDIRAVAFLIS